MESFFAKTILQDSSPYTDASTVLFYSSPNGSTWTPVTTTSYRALNGWNRSTVTLRPTNPLPTGTNYLKLDFTGGYTTSRLAEMQLIHGTGTGSGTTPTNQAPVANNDSVKTAKNTAAVFDVLANDREYDPSDARSITSVGTPQHGSASISSNKILYTPTTGYTRADSFTYTISDGRGGSATGTVNVDIPSFLFDSFEDGNSTGWTTSGGTWSVPASNRLRTTNWSSWGYKQAIWNDSAALSWGDMAFHADVSEYSTTNQPAMGIVFHYQNDSNLYRLSVNDQDGRERLERVSGGTTTVLAEHTGGTYAYFGDNTVVSLRAEIRGNKIRCFRNGVDMFGEITDASPLTSGTVGVFANGHVGWFDNMAVYNLTQTSGIEGYTYCADENQSFTLPGTCDVAYGANGSYFWLSAKPADTA